MSNRLILDFNEKMMTIEEAIEHCKEQVCDNTECSMQHKQLAEWLSELKAYREKYSRLNNNNSDNL